MKKHFRCRRGRDSARRVHFVTSKGNALVADPPGVVTTMKPTFAAFGTTALMLVGESNVKPAFDPANVTALAPSKPVPLIVTAVPAGPAPGEKSAIVGAGTTVKADVLVTVPPAVVTEIGPLVAPT